MMATASSATEVEAFRRLVERRLGLRFEDAADDRLGQVLRRRLAATSLPVEAYLRLLDDDATEPVALAGELTVGETYFLRHVEQFRAFAERVVPERLVSGGRLRLLSAGCSTGEEAYSLAMVLRDAAPGADVSITGVDLNPASLAKARSGSYTSWSLRAVPPDIRRRWFSTRGAEVRLDESIRQSVDFAWANLASGEPAELWRPDLYDAVFCRNVVMYFAPDVMAEVVARLAASIAPGGYLFLGSADTLRGIRSDLELCESHGTFYYRRPGTAATVAPAEPWYDSIRTSLDRVNQLTELPHQRAAQPGAAGRRGTWPAGPPDAASRAVHQSDALELEDVLSLMQDERYADALAALEPHPAGDPDVLLLRATALTHLGRSHEAERTCHRLLGAGRYAACAHLLLALCREVVGDSDDALDRCRAAAEDDPAFALPHVHLARLARRAGDAELATAAAQEAIRLLPGETDRRIMLFGGGFDRDGLTALCRVQAGGGE